tara:strand:+ start:9639 stop:10223 length:585 start_codon:yes stop_codon:yes gene_type:complete
MGRPIKTKRNTRSVKKLPYAQAAALLIEMGVKTLSDFRKLKKAGKRPPLIPANPEEFYEGEYVGWKEFIEAGRSSTPQHISAPTYSQVKALNTYHRIDTKTKYAKALSDGIFPPGTPSRPDNYYTEWHSWDDFLAEYSFIPFSEARRFARTLGLKNSSEWREYCRGGTKPPDIPVLPDRDYPEFISWQDFLVGD